VDPSGNVIKPLRFRFSSLFLAFTRRMIGSVDESAMNFGPIKTEETQRKRSLAIL
jgi:hypothetical protein